MTAFRSALLAAAAALAACGDTLVDHAAAGVGQGPGTLVCPAEAPVSCRFGNAQACEPESAQFCGPSCSDCPTDGPAPPPDGVAACIGEGTGAGVCGYECTGGLLKCSKGGAPACCQAAQVAAGSAHTCATTTDGGLYCWGGNESGQVTGTPTPSAPVTIPIERLDAGVVAVAAGVAHTCAALASEVRCWGRSAEGQASPPPGLSGVTALAAGRLHTCALVGATGSVRCWGTGTAVSAAPVVTGWTAITAGDEHACALGAAGGVTCWGSNTSGQLGDPKQTSSATPFASGVAAVAAGGNHTCAALLAPNSSNGGNISNAVQCWGDEPGAEFRLTPPQTTPGIPMRDASQSVVRFSVARLAAGRTHVCVQKSSADEIDCFGAATRNTQGELGGTPPAPTELAPAPGTPGATSFAAGGVAGTPDEGHTCAVFGNGGIWCWGSNAKGELGDGTTTTPGVAPDTRLLGTPVAVSGR